MGKNIKIEGYQKIKNTAKSLEGRTKKEKAAMIGVSLETLRRVEKSTSFKDYKRIVREAHGKKEVVVSDTTTSTEKPGLWTRFLQFLDIR